MSLSEMITPFWLGTAMYREAAVMLEREDGSITAKLLFKPTKITEVLDHTQQIVYEEGVDYTWDGASNLLVRTPNSRIPYFTQNDIEGREPDGSQIAPHPSFDALGRSRFGNSLYTVGAFLYEKQFSVTYEFEKGAWQGPVPSYVGGQLPRTEAILKAGEPLRVTFFGDSIFTGCDSSGMHNRPPYQESFPTLIPRALQARYGSRITCHNPSVGGMDSVWGMNHASLATENNPDLLFIGFGMNDGGRTALAAAENVKKLIETVKAACPDCEIVVTTPMVPNAQAGFLCDHAALPAAYSALTAPGIACIDFFSMHAEMLKAKDFIAMSGNNINHPNDWLIRTYAMTFLSGLIADGWEIGEAN